MAGTHVLHSFWRRHRWTALRSLLPVALLHRLHFLAFLAASSPVWLLTAFLLGAVLVNSEPNVPLAAASEDEDRHLYKKICRHQPAVTGASSSSSSSDEDPSNESSVASMEWEEEDVEEDHLVVDKEEAVAWTADDEHSIRSIGSLELERDARLEKLMSRRTTHRNLIDLDVHIPAVMAPRTKNPFDLHHHHSSSYDDDHGTAAAAAAMDAAPGSAAPSSLLGGQHTNPFDDIHIQQQRGRDRHHPDKEEDEKKALRRHESFTGAGAAPLALARSSRFKPYFVADVPEGGGRNTDIPEGGGRDADGSDNSNSSSPSSSMASDHQTQQQETARIPVRVEEAPAAWTSPSTWDGKGNANGMVMVVDVELISDSSDDDMSLQGEDATGGSMNNARDHSDDDEEDSFEVESITQQVAAGKQQLQPPCVTAVLEPRVSPPSEQGHRHQQHEEDDDKMKDASIISGSNGCTLASVEENEQRERELTEIREHQHHVLGAVPAIDSSGTSAGARVGAAGAAVAAAPTPPATAAEGPPPQPAAAAAAPTPRPTAAAAPTPPAAAGPPPIATPPQPAAAPTPRATAAVASALPSGKLSSKSKVASKKIDPKKAVFGFFRK